MTTIIDAFDLPRAEDIRAMGFVVKLKELRRSPESTGLCSPGGSHAA